MYEAISAYALDGEEIALKGAAASAFILIKPILDTGRRKAASGKRGGINSKPNGKQNESKTKANAKETEREIEVEKEIELDIKEKNPTDSKRKVFAPPTVEEVSAYCQEKGYSIDPEAFVAFYASKGWMVGKNKMKDWKQAVVTWTKSERRGGSYGRADGAVRKKEAGTADVDWDAKFTYASPDEEPWTG